MKEIIIIALAGGLIIFFVLVFGGKNKKKEDKKPQKNEIEKAKEEIPDIVKEVTMGNYMFDISQQENDGIELIENEQLGSEFNESTPAELNSIEEAYDEIDNIGSDFDMLEDELNEIDECEDSILYEIDEEFTDDVLLGEINNINESKENNNVVDEYKGLSKEMKIMLMANILKKKH